MSCKSMRMAVSLHKPQNIRYLLIGCAFESSSSDSFKRDSHDKASLDAPAPS